MFNFPLVEYKSLSYIFYFNQKIINLFDISCDLTQFSSNLFPFCAKKGLFHWIYGFGFQSGIKILNWSKWWCFNLKETIINKYVSWRLGNSHYAKAFLQLSIIFFLDFIYKVFALGHYFLIQSEAPSLK